MRNEVNTHVVPGPWGDGDGFGSVLSREVFICALDPSLASPPEGGGSVVRPPELTVSSLP